MYVEQSVILCLGRYLVVRLRKRCAGARVGKCRLNTVWWFILGCVAFGIYCHTAGADSCTIRPIGVLNAALDMGAAELCIELGVGAS